MASVKASGSSPGGGANLNGCKPLKAAVAEYLAARKREFREDKPSGRRLENITWELKRLMKHFRGVTVAELTVPRLVAYLEIGMLSAKSCNNRRGLFRRFSSLRSIGDG